MSLSTWKRTFYRTPAEKFLGLKHTQENWIAAIAHSINKWSGLSSKNLKKFGLEKMGSLIFDEDVSFSIDCSSCALCFMCSGNKDGYNPNCSICPLNKVLGMDCDFGYNSPYRKFTSTSSNNKEMLSALGKALTKISGDSQDRSSTAER